MGKPEDNSKTKLSILADMREARSGVVRMLQESGMAQVECLSLPVGDYQVGESCIVERKAASDFVISILDGRFIPQAQLLQGHCSRPIMLVEGNIFQTRSAIAPAALDGALSYLTVLCGISLVPSRDPEHTAQLILTFARHSQQGLGYVPALRVAKPKDPSILARYLVEGLPGVGPNTAKQLLDHFGTARQVFQATESQLKQVPKMGEKGAAKISDVLDHPAKSTGGNKRSKP